MLIGSEEKAWLLSDWTPRAIEPGLRSVAMVMPIFISIALRSIAWAKNSILTNCDFDILRMRSAHRWLSLV